jgi:MFS family permease
LIAYVIFVITIINQLVIGGTKPVISLYVTSLGATPAQIGLLVTAYAILPALLAIRIGQWIDRYGIRRLVSLGGFGLLISLILPIVYPHYLTFIVSQLIIGISLTGQVVALQKRIGQVKGDIEKNVAAFSLYGSMGAMLGPTFSSTLYDHYGFLICYLVNAMIMLIGMAVVFVVKKEEWDIPRLVAAKTSTESRESIWRMLRHRDLRNAVIISGLMLSNKEIFSAYFPLLGQKLGISPTMIGVILSVMGAAAMIIRLSQSYLVHRFGRGTVLTTAMYMSGIIYLLTPTIPVLIILTVLIAMLGAGLGLGQPLSLSYAIQVSPPDRRGEVLGMRITFNRVSQLTIPLMFAGIGGIAGIAAIFWGSGALLILVGYLTRTKRAASATTHAA